MKLGWLKNRAVGRPRSEVRAFRARTSASRVRRYGRWAARVQEGAHPHRRLTRKNRRHLRNTARIKTIRFCRRFFENEHTDFLIGTSPYASFGVVRQTFHISRIHPYAPRLPIRIPRQDSSAQKRPHLSSPDTRQYRRSVGNFTMHISRHSGKLIDLSGRKSTRRMTNHKLIKKTRHRLEITNNLIFFA